MNQRRWGRVVAATMCMAALGWSAPAYGAEADSTTRAAARKLGTSGVEAYQAGDYQGASEKLERAYATLKVPTLGLWSARALIKLNRWVEAAERLLAVTRLDASGDVQVQQAARAEAEQELAALSPRIPSVTIELQASAPADAKLTIDGRPLASSLLGATVPIDPGSHEIAAELGGERDQQTVSLKEAESQHVVLRLSGSSGASAPSAESPVQGAESGEPGGAAVDAPPSRTQRTVGLVVGAAGVVGLGVGTVFYFKATSDNDDAKKICPSSQGCSSAEIARHGQLVSSVKDERLVAYVGWGVGGAALVTGAVLFFTAPRSTSASAARRVQVGAAPLPQGGYMGVISGVFE